MGGKAKDQQSVWKGPKRSRPTVRGGGYSRAGGPPRRGLSDGQWATVGKTLGLFGRQLEIVRGIFDGLDEQAMAMKLGIKRATVHTYVDRIYRRLNVHCRCDIAVQVMYTCLSLSLTLDPSPVGPSPVGLAPPAGPDPSG